jgi:hypothetical protein
MNDKAKIHLSTLEMELVNNKEWIFTKQQIIEKVYHLFGELHHDYRQIVETEKDILPSMFQKPGGKISKGENYNGLPFLILDYPAMFSKENILAIRTMFWWGNFFSISLHLSGSNFKNANDINDWLVFFQEKNFSVCINEKQWEHHFHSSNFIDIKGMTEEQIQGLCKKNFFKVAKKLELSKWDQAREFLIVSFKDIITFLKINYPNGEKVL